MVTTLTSSDSTSSLNNQSLLVQNPLSLHPSDGLGFIRGTVVFLNALNTKKEKQRLFQFLNAKVKQRISVPSVVSNGIHLRSVERVGYPTWHDKYKQNQKAKGGMKSGNAPVKRTAALVEDGGHVVFTSKQFEQLLKSLPHFNQNGETAPEVKHPFREGTIYCFSCVNGVIEGWIIDNGASDHMSPQSNDSDDIYVLKNKQVINLLNGHTSVISKVGNIFS
ncbi:hypothetical protein Tco_0053381 [Tanacetum coccineum]